MSLTRRELNERARRNAIKIRLRRKKYLEELEQKIKEFQIRGIEATPAVRHLAATVAEENTQIRTMLRLQGMTDEGIEAFLNPPPRAPGEVVIVVGIPGVNPAEIAAAQARPAAEPAEPATEPAEPATGLAGPAWPEPVGPGPVVPESQFQSLSLTLPLRAAASTPEVSSVGEARLAMPPPPLPTALNRTTPAAQQAPEPATAATTIALQ